MNSVINYNEYMFLSHSIASQGAIFNLMMGKGCMAETHDLPTCAIQVTEDGFMLFVNPEYWKTRTTYQKKFLLAHEFFHVWAGHCARMCSYSSTDTVRFNIAADLVVNHQISKIFSFDRLLIDPDNCYCWLDTVFPNEIVAENQSLEFYYDKLKDSDLLGNMPQLVDSHLQTDPEGAEKFMRNLMDELGVSTQEELDNLISPTDAGDGTHLTIEKTNITAPKKRKWESIIKKFIKQELRISEKAMTQWATKNRRMVLLGNELIIPTIADVQSISIEKDKIPIYLFLDVSGSCYNLRYKFLKAAKSIPEDKFIVKAYAFDTSTEEINIRKGEIAMGGGTSFDQLETTIQCDISSKIIPKYPLVVFIFTDGDGTPVNPQFPERWMWFLSADHTAYIPKKSTVYKLADFE